MIRGALTTGLSFVVALHATCPNTNIPQFHRRMISLRVVDSALGTQRQRSQNATLIFRRPQPCLGCYGKDR